jgi:hypothetical protein
MQQKVLTSYIYLKQRTLGELFTKKKTFVVRYQVLMATTVMIIALWAIAPCTLVEVDGRFRGGHCLHQPQLTDTNSGKFWSLLTSAVMIETAMLKNVSV